MTQPIRSLAIDPRSIRGNTLVLFLPICGSSCFPGGVWGGAFLRKAAFPTFPLVNLVSLHCPPEGVVAPPDLRQAQQHDGENLQTADEHVKGQHELDQG